MAGGAWLRAARLTSRVVRDTFATRPVRYTPTGQAALDLVAPFNAAAELVELGAGELEGRVTVPALFVVLADLGGAMPKAGDLVSVGQLGADAVVDADPDYQVRDVIWGDQGVDATLVLA